MMARELTDEREAAEVAVRLSSNLTIEIRTDVMFNTPPCSFTVIDTCGRTIRILKDAWGNNLDMVEVGERCKLFKIVNRAYDIRQRTVVLHLERL